MSDPSESQPLESAMLGGNLITPTIYQWFAPTIERELVRLAEKPTCEQLDIFRSKVEGYEGEKGPGLVVFDIFALLFKFNLDTMPALPILTPKQHAALYVKLIKRCFEFACKWADDILLQMAETNKAQSLEEFINSFNCSQGFWSDTPNDNANRAK